MSLQKNDILLCGCFWHRDPDFGDVLTQCNSHTNGAHYAGSEPMTPDDLCSLIKEFTTSLGTRAVLFVAMSVLFIIKH